MKDANRNLIVRLTSAALLVPVLLVVILWERPEPMAVCVHIAVMIGMVEFYWITLRDDPVWMRVAGILLGLLVSVTMYWCPRPDATTAAIIAATLVATLLHLIRYGDLPTAAARTGLMIFGVLYVAVLLTPLALLKRFPEGSDWLFLVLSVTWLSDTGAYFSGRALGRHKLYPAISPKKSVEGAFGGLLSSVGAAVLAKLWYMPQLSWIDGILISTVGGALGQAGDLVESMIKRGYEVKDSGWIIPGHGGLLDRIDALLFSTPYVFLYAFYVMRVPLSSVL
jgi:phosphatidate cytidylyltransferase